jgi:hypothetical protein
MRRHCTALWPGPLRVRPKGFQAVMLLAAPPHSSRQLLCPSQHFIHPLLTSLHLVRSSTICFKVWPALAHAQINTHAVTHLFASQCDNTHRVPLRFVPRYFISVLLSPPVANNFARWRSQYGCVRLASTRFAKYTRWPKTNLVKDHQHFAEMMLEEMDR